MVPCDRGTKLPLLQLGSTGCCIAGGGTGRGCELVLGTPQSGCGARGSRDHAHSAISELSRCLCQYSAKCTWSVSTCLWDTTGKNQRKVAGRGRAHNLLIGIFLGKLWVQPFWSALWLSSRYGNSKVIQRKKVIQSSLSPCPSSSASPLIQNG